MGVREKLIELIVSADISLFGSDKPYAEVYADHLISNGVTVSVEAKPLKQYLTQIDEYAGLKLKFLVFKADTGERIENCFVLRPDKDRAAVEALRAYAEATDNKTLAEDIYNWIGNGVMEQKWIPISERLPNEEDANVNGSVLAINIHDGFPRCWAWDSIKDFPESFTRWMPVPEPPKECE